MSAGPCPDENTLAAFLERKLDGPAHAAVEAHLDQCDSCLSLVTLLARAATADSVDVTLEEEGPSPELAPGTKIDRYVLDRHLGTGGMGHVYAARDSQLDRFVALKLLRLRDPSPDARARFAREARLMAKLNHPNIVTVHDAGEAEGLTFIAMELVEGETVASWLRRGPRSVDEVLAVYRGAGRALARAHEAGIVHRDFKPENILLDAAGHPKVTDFGIATSLAEPAVASSTAPPSSTPDVVTREGALLGTPAFMSPEQLRRQKVNTATDQFSFAVALYSAIYGKPPFSGIDFESRRRAVVGGNFTPLTSEERKRVPERFHRVLRRALSRNPHSRYPDMDSLLDDLDRARRPSRGLFLVLGAFAVVALAAVAWIRVAPRSSDCAAVPDAEKPLVYFVLDHSLEMGLQHKFRGAAASVSGIVRVLGGRAYFGIALVPGTNPNNKNACAVGGEIVPPTPGDAPGLSARIAEALLPVPRGASSIAATLRALTPELAGSGRRTVVILVSDGGAACGAATACDATECTSNIASTGKCSPDTGACCNGARAAYCLDERGTADAIAALRAAGVTISVVGITDLPRYVRSLDAFAKAGGAPGARLVASSSPSDIDATLTDAVNAAVPKTCR